MQFSIAALAVAAVGVAATGHHGNVTYTTTTVDKVVTYCPGPTEIVHGSKTYTVTEATTLTITDCPCTITKPVITATDSAAPPPPSGEAPPPSVEVPPPAEATPEVPAPPPTGGVIPPPEETPAPPPSAGAGKAMALSGAGLAGVVGLAAFIL